MDKEALAYSISRLRWGTEVEWDLIKDDEGRIRQMLAVGLRCAEEVGKLQEEVAELKFNLAGTIGARDSGWKACEDARAIARAILDMAQERTGTQFVSDHVLNSHHWLRRT